LGGFVSAYYWIQAIVAALLIVDMYRRSESAWAAADRQRFFWAGLVGVAALFGAGPIAIGAYLLLAFPRLQPGASADPFPISEAFRKRPV
jgi:hypothetical protein